MLHSLLRWIRRKADTEEPTFHTTEDALFLAQGQTLAWHLSRKCERSPLLPPFNSSIILKKKKKQVPQTNNSCIVCPDCAYRVQCWFDYIYYIYTVNETSTAWYTWENEKGGNEEWQVNQKMFSWTTLFHYFSPTRTVFYNSSQILDSITDVVYILQQVRKMTAFITHAGCNVLYLT